MSQPATFPAGPIVFMGTPTFAVPTLRAMIAAGWPIAAVVCQPDKPAGRGQRLTLPPVKELAIAHHLPVLQPERVRRNPEFLQQLKDLAPALIVVVAYGKILPQEVLDVPTYGCLNVHASLLPRYRGAAPIQWALIRGEQETGATLMQMDVGMDTGDMLATTVLPIAPNDTAATLSPRLAEAGAQLAVERIPDWVAGRITPVKQDNDAATMAPMLAKETGRFDWQLSANALNDLLRGVTPWPGATTTLLGEVLKINAVHLKAEPANAPPGTLLALDKEGWHVATGDGVLVLATVQMPGKPARPAADVARGLRDLVPGLVLGLPLGATHAAE